VIGTTISCPRVSSWGDGPSKEKLRA